MELQERVSKYIDLKEALQEVSRAGSKRKPETSSQDSCRQRQPPAPEVRNSSQNSRRDVTQLKQSYTPLNRSRQAILQVIRENKIPITQPPSVMRVSGKGQQLYCEFHRCTRHDTESCYTLKHSIEGLIQQGYLRDFVKNVRPPIIPSPPIIEKGKASQGSGSVLGNVPVIHGGVRLSEQFGSRPTSAPRLVGSTFIPQIPISFDDRDLEVIEYPHDDVLVIKAVIANYFVQRVLIDGGSTAVFLFYPAFKSLGLQLSKFHPPSIYLVGFSGNQVPILCILSLQVRVGSGQLTVETTINFHVVECPPAYNCILGRPFLHQVQGIPSTLHLKLKFPTIDGVGCVKGDKALTRQCCEFSLKDGFVAKMEARDEVAQLVPVDTNEEHALE
ncbi:unnamed protein product [Linum trigynum]|uniref:Uncharacterized protein n=1 Tax=Linum trigynum TaxID=586398 RepID=A0AAV2F7X3_9ROSI